MIHGFRRQKREGVALAVSVSLLLSQLLVRVNRKTKKMKHKVGCQLGMCGIDLFIRVQFRFGFCKKKLTIMFGMSLVWFGFAVRITTTTVDGAVYCTECHASVILFTTTSMDDRDEEKRIE